MRVLVTGATGFIGREVFGRLMSENYEVIGLSRNKTDRKPEIKILNADIGNEAEVLKITKEGSFDAVVHCAGLAHQFGKIEREIFEKVNVLGTKNIAELAVRMNAGHFILLSSTAVYGLQNIPMDETADCKPESIYAETKLKSEQVATEICEANELPLTILRLVPVLGEKGLGNVPRLIRAINKKRFLWIGNGENKKSLIYVGDVAAACLHLLKNKRNFTETYNLAAEPVKMRELVTIISDKLKKPVPRFSIPAFIPGFVFGLNAKTFNFKAVNKISQTFEKWLSEDIYPADKIRADYGFAAETSIREAVARQCDWFLRKR